MEQIDLSQILPQLLNSPIDVWAITFLLLLFVKKSLPLFKKFVEVQESNLKCLERIESKLDKRNENHSQLATKEDVYNVKEIMLIDKLNGAVNGGGKSSHG